MPEEKKSGEMELDIKKIKIGMPHFIAILSIIVLAFFYIFFGFIGVKIILGIFFLYFLPFYFILGRFSLGMDERLVFSLFIGIVVVPTLVFYFGSVLNSLRLSIAATFVLLVMAAVALRWGDLTELLNFKK